MRKIAICALLTAVACDPQSKSQGGGTGGGVMGGGVARPGVLSKTYESCNATADCEDRLRCVSDVCRPIDASRLGEYYWASGQVALEKNQVNAAAEALGEAVAHYEAEKKDTPAGLLCDYGAALRRKPNDAKAAEQAARLLHRCVLISPSGSSEHWRGLRELAELEAQGLDPTLIGKDGASDTYLTKAPSAPPVPQGIKVEVGRTTPAGDKGYENWAKVLESEPARDAMTKCFQDWATKTQKSKLTLAMPLKLRARLGDDDIYLGGTLEILPDPAAKGDDAAAGTCLKGALAQLATDFAKSGSSDSWSGTVTLSLSGEK